MWSICVSLIMVFSKKVSLKLYLFISACNVNDWIVFVKNFILKSLVIIVEQCENIFCIMFLRIKLKCDIYILGGLYIVIIYKFSYVLLKNVVMNSTLESMIVVPFVNDTFSS
jgi:hypothetical protein